VLDRSLPDRKCSPSAASEAGDRRRPWSAVRGPPSGKDPRRFYAYAHGSASEVRAVLDLAAAWGWPISDAEARRLLDRELALLWGLTRSTSNAAARSR
jgi:hypothetical protein